MIYIDFETYSELDVREVGAYKYAAHATTEPLILCAVFKERPTVSLLFTPKFKAYAETALNELFTRVAGGELVSGHNIEFDCMIWNEVLPRFVADVPRIRISQLRCTAAKAANCALPRALGNALRAVNHTVQKDTDGRRLINKFSKPRKPTKLNPAKRNLPEAEPEDFKKFIDYCATDVRGNIALDEMLPDLHPFELRAYQHDIVVNRRGIPIDLFSVRRAIPVLKELAARAHRRVYQITATDDEPCGVAPTQVEKLRQWLEFHGECSLPNLQAKTIEACVAQSAGALREDVLELLSLRLEAGKVSSKKLVAMARIVSTGRRARGMLLYYGAHTGRAAGRLLQPQNFIRGAKDLATQIKNMEVLFALLQSRHTVIDDYFKAFESPLTTMAQCTRGFLCADPGYVFDVVDYAQIEARVLLWFAEDTQGVKDFIRFDTCADPAQKKLLDPYVLQAADLYHASPQHITSEQRRVGKNLILGCGFGLGGKNFVGYCARENLFISQELSDDAVKSFRTKHAPVKFFWYDVERCAIAAVKNRGQRVFLRNLSFYCDPEDSRCPFLKIRLPSGRELFYYRPRVKREIKFGKEKDALYFLEEFKGAMYPTITWGGTLVENIVQAVARDILAHGAIAAEKALRPVVLWVHDEVLTHVPREMSNHHELARLMCSIPPWAVGCPVKAEGFTVKRYRKN